MSCSPCYSRSPSPQHVKSGSFIYKDRLCHLTAGNSVTTGGDKRFATQAAKMTPLYSHRARSKPFGEVSKYCAQYVFWCSQHRKPVMEACYRFLQAYNVIFNWQSLSVIYDVIIKAQILRQMCTNSIHYLERASSQLERGYRDKKPQWSAKRIDARATHTQMPLSVEIRQIGGFSAVLASTFI